MKQIQEVMIELVAVYYESEGRLQESSSRSLVLVFSDSKSPYRVSHQVREREICLDSFLAAPQGPH